MVRANKGFWFTILACVVIACWVGTLSFGNPAGDPYSGKGGASIGAWYDEIWQGSGFFRLELDSHSHGRDFRYAYTTNPVTNTTPVFQGGNSTIPQDIVITKWKVTGHVHFASSGI